MVPLYELAHFILFLSVLFLGGKKEPADGDMYPTNAGNLHVWTDSNSTVIGRICRRMMRQG